MIRPGLRRALLAFGLLAGGVTAPGAAQGMDARDTADAMGPGVNILGYDGIWQGGVDAPFRQRHFRMLREAGFRHVRVNLYAFQYMDATDRLDPTVLQALDRVLEQSVAAGLIPVIDEHDFEICQSDAAVCATRLNAFWRQVSARYAGRHPEAVFEILNEPGGGMTLPEWNDIVAGVIGIIRKEHPERTIVVAALNTEGRFEERVPDLPEADRNIIVTVHYYRPMPFTHQGAEWAPEFRSSGPIDWGSKADEQRVSDDFEPVAAWSEASGRPIYLGEFGAYDRAPLPARVRYVGFLARTAERLRWPWAYWQFDHDFALYDTDRERWVEPLRDALLPPPRR